MGSICFLILSNNFQRLPARWFEVIQTNDKYEGYPTLHVGSKADDFALAALLILDLKLLARFVGLADTSSTGVPVSIIETLKDHRLSSGPHALVMTISSSIY